MHTGRRTLLGALALVLTASTFLGSAESATPGPLSGAADLEAALSFEQRILDHFHYGQVHEQHYRTAERIPGDIAQITGENDSALYTGNYLAAESFRYALAKHKIDLLRGATDPDAVAEGAFWVEQRNEARQRVDAVVEQFHRLVNISESWQTELDPHLNGSDPTANGFVDFGGGVFPGEAGLLARACTPTNAPSALNVGRDPNRGRLVSNMLWRDGTRWNCLYGTSRDAYAGVTFGLATALDFVAIDDSAMLRTIAGDLQQLTAYTLKYLWSTPRPHGSVVIPEVFGGNDLDNFWSPLFMYTPMARLNMLQVAKHASVVGGTSEQQQFWDLIWLAELAVNGSQLAGSMEVDAAQPHDSYYKFHLNHMTAYNIVRLEQDPQIKSLFHQAFGVMDATTRDDINALYEAITYAVTGEPDRLADAVLHHRQYLDYFARLNANKNKTNNAGLCGNSIECMPTDSTNVFLGGQLVGTQPGMSTDLRAVEPLPVRLRRGGDFMWQKDPTILVGDQGATWSSPAADFLLPYWMIRYYSEAAPPALEPFPTWPGPTFQ